MGYDSIVKQAREVKGRREGKGDGGGRAKGLLQSIIEKEDTDVGVGHDVCAYLVCTYNKVEKGKRVGGSLRKELCGGEKPVEMDERKYRTTSWTTFGKTLEETREEREKREMRWRHDFEGRMVLGVERIHS